MTYAKLLEIKLFDHLTVYKQWLIFKWIVWYIKILETIKLCAKEWA